MSELSLTPLHDWDGLPDLLSNSEATLAAVIKRAEKDWSKKLTQKEALDTLQMLATDRGPYGLQATVLNDSHLLIWSFDAPWYAAKERWIIEQFFVRIGRGPSDKAFAAIDLLSDKLSATGVLMATSLAADDSALGRLYQKHGYAPMSQQYLKSYNR